MKKGLKIAVSGRSGCGNTTISKILAEKLGLRFINFTFRSLANERGLDLKKILELASADDSWDREVDTRQVAIARANCDVADGGACSAVSDGESGCVLGSRLAIWMLEEADLKVYLDASPQIRAQRIIKREGGDLEETAAFTAERDRRDHERYLRIYNIDTDDYKFADLIIDTGNYTPEEIVNIIADRAGTIGSRE